MTGVRLLLTVLVVLIVCGTVTAITQAILSHFLDD